MHFASRSGNNILPVETGDIAYGEPPRGDSAPTSPMPQPSLFGNAVKSSVVLSMV